MGVYSGKTPQYRIPFMLFGDIIDPDDERRIFRTIDNQIFGAIRAHSGGNGVIRTGDTAVIQSGPGGTFEVVLDESTTEPALEAFINQIYVASQNAVRWTGLANSTTYFLFARLVEDDLGSSRENSEFTTFASTSSTVPDDGVLIMTVSVSEPGATTFDFNPAGKLLVPDLQDHIDDNQNPHGTKLFQENLVVSGLDVVDNLSIASLSISDLTVSGEAIFSGLLEIFGNLVVSGETIVSGEIKFLDAFVEDATIVSGTYGFLGVASGLDVFGPSTFHSNVVMSGFTTVDGRDVSQDGDTLDAHLVDFANPHQVEASQIGALSISGGTLLGDLLMSSGVTIDGIDPDADLPILFSGVNIDDKHTHTLTALVPPTRELGRAPRYCDTVESGVFPGDLNLIVDLGRNAYQWAPGHDAGIQRLVTQQIVPSDMLNVNALKVTSRTELILSGDGLTLELLDTDENAVPLTGGVDIQNPSYLEDVVTASGGQFTPGEFFTIRSDLKATSGAAIYLAEQVIVYNTSGS